MIQSRPAENRDQDTAIHEARLGSGPSRATILNARVRFLGLVIAWTLATPSAHANPAPPPVKPTTLWVIQGDEAVPYDPISFRAGAWAGRAIVKSSCSSMAGLSRSTW